MSKFKVFCSLVGCLIAVSLTASPLYAQPSKIGLKSEPVYEVAAKGKKKAKGARKGKRIKKADINNMNEERYS